MPTIVPRECLRLTAETVPGTYNGAGVSKIIRLTTDNAFRGIPEPMRYAIRDAGSSNRLAQTGYGQVQTKCSLQTPWYFSQSSLLIPLAIAVGSGPLLLPTVTIDHMTMLEDNSNTKIYTRYLGCTVGRMGIALTNTPASIYGMLSFDFDYMTVADITVTDFPNQALSTYPTDQPVLFTQSAGGFTFDGSRTSYMNFNLTVENINDVIYDESTYPQAIKWCGRNVSASTNFRFKTKTDRDNLQSVLPQTSAIAFADGTNVGTFDFQDSNYVTQAEDDLRLNQAHRQNVGFACYLDYTAGVDFTYVQTP